MIPENSEQFIAKIKRIVPDEEQRLLLLMTVLGMAGQLAQFVMTVHNPKFLPVEVLYSCSGISANILALISDAQEVGFKDLSGDEYVMGEQSQEIMYRKMKYIVTELYKVIQEDEKI